MLSWRGLCAARPSCSLLPPCPLCYRRAGAGVCGSRGSLEVGALAALEAGVDTRVLTLEVKLSALGARSCGWRYRLDVFALGELRRDAGECTQMVDKLI